MKSVVFSEVNDESNYFKVRKIMREMSVFPVGTITSKDLKKTIEINATYTLGLIIKQWQHALEGSLRVDLYENDRRVFRIICVPERDVQEDLVEYYNKFSKDYTGTLMSGYYYVTDKEEDLIKAPDLIVETHEYIVKSVGEVQEFKYPSLEVVKAIAQIFAQVDQEPVSLSINSWPVFEKLDYSPEAEKIEI